MKGGGAVKKLRVIFYVLLQSLKNAARNLFMVFASIIVVFFVLLVVGSFIEAGIVTSDIIGQVKERPVLKINFHYYVDEETAQQYYEAIAASPEVKQATYISKQENFENMLKEFEDNREYFENLDKSGKLKYASVEVQLNNYADGRAFVDGIMEDAGDMIDSAPNIFSVVEKMEKAQFWINICTIAAALVMTALSLLLIFNTVKLTVVARHREIEIMKFIGATNTYIITPFVIEGVLTGLAGAALAFLALGGVYNGVYKLLLSFSEDANIVPLTFAASGSSGILVFYLLFGACTGFIASIFAARKHIKV